VGAPKAAPDPVLPQGSAQLGSDAPQRCGRGRL